MECRENIVYGFVESTHSSFFVVYFLSTHPRCKKKSGRETVELDLTNLDSYI